MHKILVVGILVTIGLTESAFADWWIVRSSDQECLVVDIEPTDKSVTKIGKDSYKTEEDAEADAKQLCTEPTMEPKPDSDDE